MASHAPQRTFSQHPDKVDREWLLIDAEGLILGRLASTVATLLRGKHKPTFTPHVDCGDHVVIVNAEKIALSGTKIEQKQYFWHTGHAGGIREVSAGKLLRGAHPERVLEKAVERMLPRGTLGRQQLRKLRVYGGQHHPHQAQKPKFYDFGSISRKNMLGSAVMDKQDKIGGFKQLETLFLRYEERISENLGKQIEDRLSAAVTSFNRSIEELQTTMTESFKGFSAQVSTDNQKFREELASENKKLRDEFSKFTSNTSGLMQKEVSQSSNISDNTSQSLEVTREMLIRLDRNIETQEAILSQNLTMHESMKQTNEKLSASIELLANTLKQGPSNG